MKDMKASPAIRFFLFVVSSVIWLGIWLTSFELAHWVLYLPAGLLLFAAISGICPGLIISRLIFPNKDEKN